MKIYCVGGAVRDELLGRKGHDRDYVVVGATQETLIQQGFKPVGKDFPVFLHPRTHEEYALARTERKTARGYTGFHVHAAPDVTLEQDLARRDLTINAIARDAQGRLIDPFGGVGDLHAGILRHVGPAFVEDPVRVLRTARFAARLGFQVASETEALMQRMTLNGEVDALVPERVWQEISRGLMEPRPSRMFTVLRHCGALAKILPEVNALFGVPQSPTHHPEIDTGAHVMAVVDEAARRNYSLAVRFAALTHDLGKGVTPRAQWPHHVEHGARGVVLTEGICQRLRAPNDCRQLALITTRYHGDVHRILEQPPVAVLALFAATDALRKPQRFDSFLQVCVSDFYGRPGYQDRHYLSADYLRRALTVVRAIDVGAIARQCDHVEMIKARIHAARLDALQRWVKAAHSGISPAA